MSTQQRNPLQRAADEGGVSVAPAVSLPHRTLEDVRERLEGAVEILVEAEPRYRSLLAQLTQKADEAMLPVRTAELSQAAVRELEMDGALERVEARSRQEGWSGRSAILDLAKRVEALRTKLARRLVLPGDRARFANAPLTELLARSVPWGQGQEPAQLTGVVNGRTRSAGVVGLSVVGIALTSNFGQYLHGFNMLWPFVFAIPWVGFFRSSQWFSVRDQDGHRELVRWTGWRRPRVAQSFRVKSTDRLRLLEKGSRRRQGVGVRHELWLETSLGHATLLSVFDANSAQARELTRVMARAEGCGADLPPG